MSRNPTARTSVAISLQKDRTEAQLSEPGLMATTRKIAARVRLAVTACGTGCRFSVASRDVIGSVPRRLRIGRNARPSDRLIVSAFSVSQSLGILLHVSYQRYRNIDGAI